MSKDVVELETVKYYYFNGQRVAMRRCDVGGPCDDPLYLHGDHLGTVSLTTDSSGAVVAQARYMPYGEVRWESSPSLTDPAKAAGQATRSQDRDSSKDSG